MPRFKAKFTHIFKKLFSEFMGGLRIVFDIGIPAGVLYYAYSAFTGGYVSVGFLFLGTAYLLAVNNYISRLFLKKTKEFEETKNLLFDRNRVYAICNNQRFDDINKTLEVLKKEVKGLKEREGKQAQEVVSVIKQLMTKNDEVIQNVNQYTEKVKEKIQDEEKVGISTNQ